MALSDYERKREQEAKEVAESWAKTQELTDLAFECESFPENHWVCAVLNVVNPEKTWMLLESMLDKKGEKLVAGCHVKYIRIVPKPKPWEGFYTDREFGAEERDRAMDEALKAVGSEPNVKIDWWH